MTEADISCGEAGNDASAKGKTEKEEKREKSKPGYARDLYNDFLFLSSSGLTGRRAVSS